MGPRPAVGRVVLEPAVTGLSVERLITSQRIPLRERRFWSLLYDSAPRSAEVPRIMRHTAASWLVMDGVPLYDVQHLLGHESFRTTERYAHLAPDAHDRVMQSWAQHHAESLPHE